MGKLTDFAKRNSPFIKLNDGESIEAVYKGFKESSYMGKETVVYLLDNKMLTSSSGKLALLMDNVTKETKVKITKHGTGMNTTYSVEVEGKDGDYQPVGVGDAELPWDENV